MRTKMFGKYKQVQNNKVNEKEFLSTIIFRLMLFKQRDEQDED